MIDKETYNDIDLLIVRKIDGTISSEEEVALKKHFEENPDQKSRFQELKSISEISADVRVQQNVSIDQRWMRLESQISHSKGQNKYRKLFIQSISVAASILICFFIYSKFEKDIYLVAENGEIVRSELPDKSIVYLNSGSKLEFNQSLFASKRSVILEGEAFFEVEKKRKPFIVLSDFATIEVLGTEFNVRNRGSQIKVSCQEGSVKVSNTGFGGSVILNNSYGTVVFKGSKPSQPYHVDSPEINGWTNGILVFNQTPINEVLNELERTFEISISRSNIDQSITYNGEFDNIDIDEILEIIALSLDLNLSKIDDENYLIN